jgi:replicative DNA helicase
VAGSPQYSSPACLRLTATLKAYKSEGHVIGVTTGLRDLDSKLGGLHPSDLLIFAARPSMGKTSLAVNIAYNAADRYAATGAGISPATPDISMRRVISSSPAGSTT